MIYIPEIREKPFLEKIKGVKDQVVKLGGMKIVYFFGASYTSCLSSYVDILSVGQLCMSYLNMEFLTWIPYLTYSVIFPIPQNILVLLQLILKYGFYP